MEEITRFVDEGGNLLVTGGPNLGQAVRELALQHGFEFDEPETMVIDHNNYDTHLVRHHSSSVKQANILFYFMSF